jgi:hypothetical protein
MKFLKNNKNKIGGLLVVGGGVLTGAVTEQDGLLELLTTIISFFSF